MRLFGIIPDEVVHHFFIKGRGFVQVIYIPAHKLLLDSPVESFQVAVRFRMLGVIEVMDQAMLKARLLEVFGEFTSVVCLDALGGKRGYFDELLKEITAISRGVRLIGIGESESAADIEGSEDIAFNATGEDRDRIHLYQVARELGQKTLPALLLLSTGRFPKQEPTSSAADGELVGFGNSALHFEVMDDPTYGGLRYRLNTSLLTGYGQGWGHGGFIHSGMSSPVLNNKALNKGMDYPLPPVEGGPISDG